MSEGGERETGHPSVFVCEQLITDWLMEYWDLKGLLSCFSPIASPHPTHHHMIVDSVTSLEAVFFWSVQQTGQPRQCVCSWLKSQVNHLCADS